MKINFKDIFGIVGKVLLSLFLWALAIVLVVLITVIIYYGIEVLVCRITDFVEESKTHWCFVCDKMIRTTHNK